MIQKIKRIELDDVKPIIERLRLVKCKNTAVAVLSLEQAYLAQMEGVLKTQKEMLSDDSDEQIKAYKADYDKLRVEHLLKDEKGNIVTDERGMSRVKDMEVFKAEIQKLGEQHPEAYAKMTESETAYAQYINEDIELVYEDLHFYELNDSMNLSELQLVAQFWDIDPSKGMQIEDGLVK